MDDDDADDEANEGDADEDETLSVSVVIGTVGESALSNELESLFFTCFYQHQINSRPFPGSLFVSAASYSLSLSLSLSLSCPS